MNDSLAGVAIDDEGAASAVVEREDLGNSLGEGAAEVQGGFDG